MSGRPPFQLTEEATEGLLDMIENGIPKGEIAQDLGCSVTTLNKRISEIRQKEGVLLNWRAIRSLKLTELQAAILEKITPEKMDDASLKDLVLAYKILAEKEDEIENPEKGKITGLVAYLIELEKRNYVIKDIDLGEVEANANAVDGEFRTINQEEEVPQF